MTAIILENFIAQKWMKGTSGHVDIASAVTGETVAQTSSTGVDFKAAADFARNVGGPALRAMTIHERAHMVKKLGLALNERKEELYALNAHSGATRRDGWIDIEGGAMTLFSASSKARRELPNDHVIMDGDAEQISKTGTWMGQHVYTSMQGLGLLINAYNFPIWGMLEKLGSVLISSIRFIAEQDSLNATVLGPDATADSPEFDLFIKEVVSEMTVKAGQKCTAIRRAFVPAGLMDAAQSALIARLEKIRVGKPDAEGVRMGALVSQSQRNDVRNKVKKLAEDGTIVFGNPHSVELVEANDQEGAFMSPILLRCDTPWKANNVHSVEAFGPVSTLMPYTDIDDAIKLCNEGLGSLVMSVFTYSPDVARQFVIGSGAYHGRIAMINRDNAKESTGHGSPLPVLVHGGPGRAGGGEEMGGVRGIKHFMQRTAIQGTPDLIAGATNVWMKGAAKVVSEAHPFRFNFDDLELGKTLVTEGRKISLKDIEHFAEFTGDNFYAHMDPVAAEANPFFPGRVAHGYLLLSFAAGLFVDPAPGPVLANYGLDNLRFLTPVSPDDTIKVQLTAKSKKKRNEEYGEVKWDVEVSNEKDELVATYDLLTMNAIET